MHINVKELRAAIATVQSLARPNTAVLLSVDNQVTFFYLRKSGGKIPHLNALLRPFLKWCMQNRIHLSIQWVPPKDMQADSLSRWTYDQGDYTLDTPLFNFLLHKMHPWIVPTVDCFASPGNHKLQNFISRWAHHQAVQVDALTCPLGDFTSVYANPPWSCIQDWLVRLRENRHVKCLLICPFWVSTRWWPLLTQLHVPNTPSFLIEPFWGMFTNCRGERMPPPGGPFSVHSCQAKIGGQANVA